MQQRRLVPVAFMLALPLFGMAADRPSPAEVPVASFFRAPALQSPALSPDGQRVAMVIPGPEGRTVIALADVKSPDRRVGLASFNDADVRRLWWVNDRRLAFNAIDYQSAAGEQFGGGLYAVDIDGQNVLWLVGRGNRDEITGTINTRPLRWNYRFVGTLRDGSDDVLVQRWNIFDTGVDPGSMTPLRLNTRTRGLRSQLDAEPRHASDWAYDAKGQPVAATSVDRDGLARVWWRPPATADWGETARFDAYGPSAQALWPMAADDQGRLLVSAPRQDAQRTRALYRYDPVRRQRENEPVVALKDFDFDGELIFNRRSGELVGATYTSDAPGVAWLDPALRTLQQRIDALLPGTANTFQCDPCDGDRRVIVTAWSDRQPPVYFLFDREAPDAQALRLIGSSHPDIDARLMAEQDFHRVPARDGASIPVYVTRPQSQGPWPAVVLVHGGPWVRGTSWGWHPESQFLASRGYLVIEPEYRGSRGHGEAWYRAGFKQWGLAMQDDVTDATRWAVSRGLADPRRLVIAGASYGGYATLMGLLKEPDLYRAGVNWVGVTDIDLMYSVDWSDLSQLWKREGMPRLIGDRDKDAEQLRRTSPLLRAAEITRPLLMAYGGKDLRVPIVHGRKMRDALRAAGKAELEWVEYELEGHGFLLEASRVDFWSRVERFLARHTL